MADRWNLRSDLADLLANEPQASIPMSRSAPERWPASPVCACWHVAGACSFLT
nr:ABC transporter, ATP-binding protein [Escherichia coli]